MEPTPDIPLALHQPGYTGDTTLYDAVKGHLLTGDPDNIVTLDDAFMAILVLAGHVQVMRHELDGLRAEVQHLRRQQ